MPRPGHKQQPDHVAQRVAAIKGKPQSAQHIAKRVAARRATLAMRAGLAPVPVGEAVCTTCSRTLPYRMFSGQVAHQKRLHGTCTDCQRVQHLLRTYGLTAAQWEALWEAQAGCCPVCTKPLDTERGPGRTVVDHDHATGAVRGLLHAGCNLGVGHYEAHGVRIAAYLAAPPGLVLAPPAAAR